MVENKERRCNWCGKPANEIYIDERTGEIQNICDHCFDGVEYLNEK